MTASTCFRAPIGDQNHCRKCGAVIGDLTCAANCGDPVCSDCDAKFNDAVYCSCPACQIEMKIDIIEANAEAETAKQPGLYPVCTECGWTLGALLFQQYEAGMAWSGMTCCEVASWAG